MSEPFKILKVIPRKPEQNAIGVEIIPEEYLPKEFTVEFRIASLSDAGYGDWIARLTIRTEIDKIPRTICVEIQGNAVGKSGFEMVHRGRVDRDHLLAIATEIRHLEARAAMECMKCWLFDVNDARTWVERSKSRYLDGDKEIPADLSELDLKKIRREVMGANGYTKRSPEFLREVARVFEQARSEKKRTNVAVQEHFYKKDGREPSMPTVRSWVAGARTYIREPSQPTSARNSSPIKSVQDVRKPTTTKKSGESK